LSDKYNEAKAKVDNWIDTTVNSVWTIDLESDEILTYGETSVKLAFATDVLLSKYNSYIEFIDDEIGYELVLIPYVELLDFKWIEVGNIITDDV